jgi:hypothetical protein
MSSRRTNPPRAARSPAPRDETDESDGQESDLSYASDDSPFFSPSENQRGCPTCREIPTDFLRLYPDSFKCPICLTEEVLNVFAFVPCGHCICGHCKNMWIPCNTPSPLRDMANLNISNTSNNQGAASGRRGRPLMSPHERSAASTRQRKNIILTSIENWQFNNGIILDTIFYCDILETFQSPDGEPREVFRARLTDAMNTEENGDFGYEHNSWVYALLRVSVHFQGDNPLECVNYTITIPSGCFNLSLTMPLIKGLKDKDVILCAYLEAQSGNIEVGELPSQNERTSYFTNNILTSNESIVRSGEELVDVADFFRSNFE